jgi:glycosyltransferase involved in cell wall biosynthesis
MIGGIETHLIELSKLLRKNRIQCSVLFYKNHQNLEFYKLLDAEGIKYEFCTGNLYYLLKRFQQLNTKTIIHTHGYKAGILGRLFANITKLHCVSTYHAGEAGTGMVKLYNAIDKKLSSLSLNFAVSDLIKQQICNATLLENFISLRCPPIAKQHDYHSSPLRVGFVGRLSFEKGPDIFCELAQSMQNNTHVEFHVFGDGPIKHELPAAPNLNLHGLVKRDEIWHKIDVLLICSRAEGLPMAMLEAMAHKVIVISHAVGEISNIIDKKTGVLLHSNSVQTYQYAIESLLTHSCKHRLSIADNAYKLIEERFCGKKQFNQLNNAYTFHDNT